MKNFITGGTGYIGSRLARLIADQGEEVLVFGLPALESPLLHHKRITVVHGDILSRSDLESAMEGSERVYHLAAYARNWAQDSSTFYRVNVLGTDLVLRTALKLNVKRVVCTSSNVTFGPSNGSAVCESTKRTHACFTDYERSKLLAEHVARQYARKGLHVVIVNPTRVFGPGEMSESNSVTKMISLYLEGKWRFVPGNGSAIGNYVFVDDLIQGFVRAMNYGRCGENYILGGENISFDQFFQTVSAVTKQSYRLFRLPAPLAVWFATAEEWRARLFRHYPLLTPGWMKTFLADWVYSSDKAKKELGYTITPFRDAVDQTTQWIMHDGPLGAVS